MFKLTYGRTDKRLLLHNLKLEIEFLATKDGRQIELPKLSREAKRLPSLIQVDYELEAKSAPEIRKTDVRSNRRKFCGCIERKWCTGRYKASERVTVEMISMRWIRCPIRIRIVRRNDLQPASGLCDAMQLGDEPKHVRHVLDHVTTNDLVELIVSERIRNDAQIMNDVGVTPRVRIDTDRAGKLVLATTDVEDASCNRSGTIAVAHAISSYSKGAQPTLRD